MGGVSGSSYISAVYTSCIEEDPEIDIADLVFEHLLSLESVVEFLEQEDDDTEDEEHLPIQWQQASSQTVVVFSKPIIVPIAPEVYGVITKDYALYQNDMELSSYINEVFHPPAV